MGHLFHFPVISQINKKKYTHTHSSIEKENEYEHNSTDNWHVMNGSTNDVWINPWIAYLKENGVDILTNTELVKINYKKKNITSVEIKKNGMVKQLKSKEYIL